MLVPLPAQSGTLVRKESVLEQSKRAVDSAWFDDKDYRQSLG